MLEVPVTRLAFKGGVALKVIVALLNTGVDRNSQVTCTFLYANNNLTIVAQYIILFLLKHIQIHTLLCLFQFLCTPCYPLLLVTSYNSNLKSGSSSSKEVLCQANKIVALLIQGIKIKLMQHQKLCSTRKQENNT